MKGFAVVTLKLLLESPWNYCEILNILEIVNIIKLNFFFSQKKFKSLTIYRTSKQNIFKDPLYYYYYYSEWLIYILQKLG